jgi:hypothetical protein
MVGLTPMPRVPSVRVESSGGTVTGVSNGNEVKILGCPATVREDERRNGHWAHTPGRRAE